MFKCIIFFLLWTNCLWAQSDPYYLYVSPESSFKVYENLKEALVSPSRVRAIKLKGMNLRKIPRELKKLKNLECLDLTNNKITLNKEDVKVLKSLRNIKCILLRKNRISKIEREFVNAMPLKSLEVLGLGSNRIEKLPPEFEKLKRVKFLSLIDNPFKSFPESVSKMDGLVALWFFKTKVRVLNCDFSNLDKLEDVNFGDNLLESVKVRFNNSIERVNFAKNKIRKLEGGFEKYPDLEILNLQKNPKFVVPEKLKLLVKKGVLIVD